MPPYIGDGGFNMTLVHLDIDRHIPSKHPSNSSDTCYSAKYGTKKKIAVWSRNIHNIHYIGFLDIDHTFRFIEVLSLNCGNIGILVLIADNSEQFGHIFIFTRCIRQKYL